METNIEEGKISFPEEFSAKIIARLEAGTAPWQKPWTPGKQRLVPHNPVSGTAYKGVNRFALGLLSDFSDPRWMTLKQINEAGLALKEGSKGTSIMFYKYDQEQDRLDENGKPVLSADGKPEKEIVRLERPVVYYPIVYNGEQIEGMPPLQLTDVAYQWDPLEKAEGLLAASGAALFHDQSDRAYYSPAKDEIHLCPRENFPDPGAYYGTALHELGHWTGHPERLDRDFGPHGSEKYAREELRAEIASWMLSEDIGIDFDPGDHASYVQSWIEALKDDPHEILRACRDAEKIKGYVMELERSKELGREDPAAKRPALIPLAYKEKFLEVPPFEAQEVKGLGGRWDQKTGQWYVPKGAELAAFEAWIPKPNPALENTYLEVPLSAKNQAKAFGARWDQGKAKWYAPKGADLSQLKAWLPALNPATEKTFLNVPMAEKDEAKALGARWDKEAKRWFAPRGTDLSGLRNWLPVEDTRAYVDAENSRITAQIKRGGKWEHLRDEDGAPKLFESADAATAYAKKRISPPPVPLPTLSPQEEFARAIEVLGGDLGGNPPVMDGKKRRIPRIGAGPKDAGFEYQGFADAHPAGWMRNFGSGDFQKWRASGHVLTPEAEERLREEFKQRREAREQEQAKVADEVAIMCSAYFADLSAAPREHAYLLRKGIGPEGLKVNPSGKVLVAPVMNTDGEIRNLQYIQENGEKSFEAGGQKKGLFALIGADMRKDEPSLAQGEILMAEGYATGATLHEVTGKPVVVAFDAGNLKPVAESIREKFPRAAITICADNDHAHTRHDGTPYNIGVAKAAEAAEAVGGKFKVPPLSAQDKERGLTDFNDVFLAHGPEAVARASGLKPKDRGVSLAG
ncbi:MAG: DUF5710 domain-containing protein [Desulfovibrio sp.]|jgi:antirestriction protein ArdC/phage/plasmid primase-like uncharacterized protein|nr:DUF5710 domain-containing protein [Desulfovibrio sp.]